MANLVSKGIAAAAIAVGLSCAFMPATASAGGLQLGIHVDHRGHAQGRYWRHRGHERDRGCSVRHALRKAHRMGLRHAGVARVDRHRVVVRGWRHRHRARVVFANRRSCPVIRARF